ncbi:hypothetical protein [Marispirochaeta aestuarii]|uniref:hypothetical protein n=1 Tax=Marispirochaeta aestuarii TaxID=1963862 RepID=UPI002ABDB151|nr:hypothetical protein [Marispirochaeta aestuarii]
MNTAVTSVAKKILDIEKRTLNSNLDDLEAWYDIRVDIFNKINRVLGICDIAHVTKIRSKKLNNRVRISLLKKFYSIKASFVYKIRRKESYLFWGHPRRKLEEDLKYWDIYSDPIISGLNITHYLIIEKPFGHQHFSPIPNKDIIYYESIENFEKFSVIGKMNIPDKVINTLNKIQIEINKEFNLNLDIVDYGIKKYTKNNITERLMYLFLKMLKPKILFLVVSYRKEPIIRAAKKLKIPTVELQHGMISKFHLGYSFNTQLPKKSFPDYLFTFGEYWKSTSTLPLKMRNIFSIGYPYLEMRIKEHNIQEKKRQVVFISQGPIGKELSKFAIKYAEMNLDVSVIYKLHPGEVLRWRIDYKELEEGNRKGLINVIDSQRPSLYSLFAESIAQVGVYSTAIFEGIRFGCKTFLVDLPGVDYLQEMIDAGVAELITSADEIKIDSVKKIDMTDISKIFAVSWKKNFKNALDKILQENSNQ